MNLSLFDYNLPEELIAQDPPLHRGDSRMLIYDKKKDIVTHSHFNAIVNMFNPGDVLVINDTKVIPAKLRGVKDSGAKAEVLLIEELAYNQWKCLVKPGSKLKHGARIIFKNDIIGEVIDIFFDGTRLIEFSGGNLMQALCSIGEMPLPPYINRNKLNQNDFDRYQTVFAEKLGAIAAPTAGLHFNEDILDSIKKRGIEAVSVTLHVGLGTFKPVEVENIEDHVMHTEKYEITKETAEKINKAKKRGNKIIAVGTTSVRTLESSVVNGEVRSGSGETNIFIFSPYRFKVVDHLLTNFHLPKSTLLMLVCAFAGREKTLELYNEAIEEKYRFYSYGDCMLVGT